MPENLPITTPDHHQHARNNSTLGFWLYLMTDLICFACLFAAFAVLRGNNFNTPPLSEILNQQYALAETLILLTSSFTCGLALLAVKSRELKKIFLWFGATFVLGFVFLIMELYEFRNLIKEGLAPTGNAMLSSFFSLLGAHGLHIAFGLLWIVIMLVALHKKDLNENLENKFLRLSLFWHFLDVVWIFIFTIVYLMSKT